jgi:CRP-like cAMP-binding protein
MRERPLRRMTCPQAAMAQRHYATGERIIHAGDPGDALFVLLSGSVEVRLPGTAGKPGPRIEVFAAGMTFGEMALVDGAPRSADVIALEPVSCRVLELRTFEEFDERDPKLKIGLLQQITRQLSASLRRRNAEVQAFKGR